MKIAVIAPDVHAAREWTAKNHDALRGCDVQTMGARMAPLALRGDVLDRVYIVRTDNHGTQVQLDQHLITSVHGSLIAQGGESILVAFSDQIEPVIRAECSRGGCAAIPKVVVINRAGETLSRAASCPTHAATFVGAATERIEPLITGGSIR